MEFLSSFYNILGCRPDQSSPQKVNLIIRMHNYNTHRKSIVLKVYGRNIQLLVEHLVAIPDRATEDSMCFRCSKIIKPIEQCKMY